MNTKRKLGFIQIMISAISYGAGPCVLALSFVGGNNAINASFVQPLVALLLQLPLFLIKKDSLQLDFKHLIKVVLYAGIGMGLTLVLLTASYAFIPVSIATSLHFVYPVMVAILGAIFWKEKFNIGKLIALALCVTGVLFFAVGEGDINIIGVILAISSGCVYSLYIQLISHTNIVEEVGPNRMLFYTNMTVVVVAFFVSLITQKLTFALTLPAWIFVICGATLSDMLGNGLFQIGVKKVGGFTASILSTLEPVTGLIFGFLLLGESLYLTKIIGCIFILASVICVTFFSREK